MDTAPSPNIVCLPYLPVAGSYQIGEWVLVPYDQYAGSWLNPTYERRVKQLFERFVGINNAEIKNVTMVISAKHGANGTIPNATEGAGLQLAANFSAIDELMSSSGDKQLRMVTTDNTELQIWPILESGFVAYPTGLLLQTKHGGWELDRPGWTIPCPLELNIPLESVRLDMHVAQALYDIVINVSKSQDPNILRLVTAIGWWTKVWRNSVSITWSDRVVFLKTAFEALLDTSSTPEAAKKLKTLFEDGEKHASTKIEGFLWTSTETASRIYVFNRPPHKSVTATDLEHWFLTFGEKRNDVIHNGALARLDYTEKDSAYSGNVVLVGERVFREAVKMQLEMLGYSDLWQSGLNRAIHEAHQAFKTTQLNSPNGLLN